MVAVLVVVHEAEHHPEVERHRQMDHKNRAVEVRRSIRTGLAVHRITQITHAVQHRKRIALEVQHHNRTIHTNLAVEAVVRHINLVVAAAVHRTNRAVVVEVLRLDQTLAVRSEKDKF